MKEFILFPVTLQIELEEIMETLALILMVLGIFSIALHNTTQRWLLREKILSKTETLVAQHSISILFLLSAFWWWNSWGTAFHSHTLLFWFSVMGTSIANIFIQNFNAKAKSLAEASLIAPIQAMTPGLVTVAALLIGEYPTKQGIAGIILIGLGVYIHSRENATTLREYLQPFQFLMLPANFSKLPAEKQNEAIKNRNALRWAYASAGMGTFGLLFDGLTARNGDIALGFGIQAIILTTTFLILYSVVRKKETASLLPLGVRLKAHLLPILLIGIFYGFHVVFIMTSFRLAPIAYIGSLKRLSIPLIIFLSWIILKEKKAVRRLWPASIVTFGALLLAFDGSMGRILDHFTK